MTIQTRFSSLFCAAVIGLALNIPATAVADSKTLPGMACHPISNTQSAFHFTNGVFNNEANARFFLCPILREKTTNAPILKLQVKVVRPPAASDFSCAFRSLRPNGNLVQSVSRTTSKAGLQNLTVNNLRTVTNGVVVVDCNIPSAARIVSYNWNE